MQDSSSSVRMSVAGITGHAMGQMAHKQHGFFWSLRYFLIRVLQYSSFHYSDFRPIKLGSIARRSTDKVWCGMPALRYQAQAGCHFRRRTSQSHFGITLWKFRISLSQRCARRSARRLVVVELGHSAGPNCAIPCITTPASTHQHFLLNVTSGLPFKSMLIGLRRPDSHPKLPPLNMRL